jgi:DMSO/TMAO reductase YedYZ molybdopterin-dependent catalytic subunit
MVPATRWQAQARRLRLVDPPPSEPGAGAEGRQRTEQRGWAALAGAAAAAVALAAGEVPAAVSASRGSLITSVGNEIVDRYAASLKDLAVALFGQGDKAALITGIVVVSLGLGAVLGDVGRRRRWVAVAGFAAFGLVGWVAMVGDPGAGTDVATVSAAVAVTAGTGSLLVLLALLDRPVVDDTWRRAPGRPVHDDPTVKAPDRRAFLVATGSVGVAAGLLAAGGRAIRGRSTVDAERLALQLPAPADATPIPSSGLVAVEGVSPYITPTEDFFRIDTALGTPQVPADSWRLRVDGLVDRPYEIGLDDLLAMDLVEAPVTIACVSNEVGGRLVGTARWLGVPLVRLLERAGPRPEATQVVGRSVDRFTVGFPTAAALDGRVAMVAVGMNGEPLPARHGYPARLVVSGLYGYVSATKWLSEIELTRFEDFDAYWVPRGWAKEAPVKTQSRIDVPRAGSSVAAGVVAVAGVAWAPNTGIDGVELRVDDGPWTPTDLGAVASDDTWVQWHLAWRATPGRHRLAVRATDRTGEPQTDLRQPPRPDGATGHHTVEVTVS